METGQDATAGAAFLSRFRSEKYRPGFGATPPSRLDEGYSDDTKSLTENDGAHDSEEMLPLPEWALTLSEVDRAELAYSLLGTLRTSTIANVVDRLTPLLHMDPILKLPPEITAEIFFYLDPPTLLSASLASRTWRSRILDSRLWRHLYIHEGWGVDIEAIRNFERSAELSWSHSKKARHRRSDGNGGRIPPQSHAHGASVNQRRASRPYYTAGLGSERPVEGGSGDMDFGRIEWQLQPDAEGDHEMVDCTYNDHGKQSPTNQQRSSLSSGTQSSQSGKFNLAASPGSISSGKWDAESKDWIKPTLLTGSPRGSAKLNWAYVYKQRLRLEENWRNARYTAFQLPHPMHPSEGHRECVYAIQFSGNWLVSGSRDRTVRIWNLETKRLRGSPLVGHMKSVLCLQFDPSEDEDIIASGSSDRNVIIWRFSTGEKIHELTGAHEDSVLNLRFDKRFLVTCSKDKLVKVWNREELLPTDPNYPKIHKGAGVRYPSYIVDTSTIPSAVLESQIANRQIRTLSPYSLLMTLDAHGAAVNAIQIGEDDIVSASGDRLIKVWDIHNGRCRKTLVGHSKGIACVQIDRRRIISGSNDDTVRIYDYASGAEVACLQGHRDLVRTVQAGFGDLPGADETLKLEAMAVDNTYWEARLRGEIDPNVPNVRRGSRRLPSVGSKLAKDITAVGARIPPGGGGSKWARIVSGSYDETIIIWMKDLEGKWFASQRLRQEDAANAASEPFLSQSPGSSSRNPDQAEAALEAQLSGSGGQHPNPIASSHQASNLQSGLENPGATAPLGTAGNAGPASGNQVNAADPSQQPQQGHGTTQPVNIQQPPTTNAVAVIAQGYGPPTTALGAANLPPATNPHPGYAARPQANHPTSRVFKLQFDARKLICASQDWRIVGWDFACGDSEIEEATQFFTS